MSSKHMLVCHYGFHIVLLVLLWLACYSILNLTRASIVVRLQASTIYCCGPIKFMFLAGELALLVNQLTKIYMPLIKTCVVLL